MRRFRYQFLRNLCFINLVLMFYPTAMFARIVIFRTNTYGLGMILAFLSLFGGVFLNSQKAKKIFYIENLHKKILINLIGILLIFFWVYVIYRATGNIRSYFEIITALVFYFVGVNKQKVEDWLTIELKDIVIGIIGVIFLNIACRIAGLAFNNLVYINIYLAMLILLVIFNQFSIEKEILKKSNNIGVQKYINNYNLALVLKSFIGFIIIFNFNSLISNIIKLILKLFVKLGKIYVILVGKLSNISNVNFKSNKLPEFIKPENGSSTVKDIINTIIIIAFIAILVIIIFKVFKYCRENFALFLAFIKKLLVHKKVVSEDSVDYVDDVKTIKENWVFNKKIKLKKDTFKKRKLLDPKGYLKFKDVKLKVRFMYLILLNKVESYCNINIKKSDSTVEINKKINEKLQASEIDNITKIYNDIRYGNFMIDKEEFLKYEEDFEVLNKKIKEK